jgi:signal transduction histidine kinase
MALIDDILDYSKIESGKLALERSNLDLVCTIIFSKLSKN